MMQGLGLLLRSLGGSFRDLLPVIAVIAFFQFFVIGDPLPDLLGVIVGLACVVAGLTLFVFGLELGLFPIGESMAHALARKGSLFWLIIFAFALGAATTLAEPTLIAVASEAASMAATEGIIVDSDAARAYYALELRLVVALAVACAIVLGVLRILKGWPLHHLVIGGYVIVLAMTTWAPEELVGVAYDMGGVTTSTITVPLVTALGVGLAMSIEGRNAVLDGFGLIAFASLLPMMFVLGFGMLPI